MGRAPFVTNHAIERYQERVSNVPADLAREALSSPAIARALEFGAPYVRLPTGQRIVIENGAIVTVLPAGCPHWRLGCPK